MSAEDNEKGPAPEDAGATPGHGASGVASGAADAPASEEAPALALASEKDFALEKAASLALALEPVESLALEQRLAPELEDSPAAELEEGPAAELEEGPAAELEESPAAEAEPPESVAGQTFIVGIGASAGGLEALGALFRSMTLEGMAFVVVQHLSPQHESVLPALLSRLAHLKVVAAEDGVTVQPEFVYVIPPNANLSILRGVLHVIPLTSTSGPRLPIDHFFRSLALDQGTRSVGVVLSGTGTDGTFGLKAIKDAGGITFAQEPTSAKYDGMPRSALDNGWADFCLTPEGIASELMNLSRHPYVTRSKVTSPRAQEGLSKLIALMRAAFGNDLTYYKTSTIERRIERRMALHKIERLDSYVKYVRSNRDELALLYKDMLIGVTSFFRDGEPFDALKSRILPRIMEQKEQGAPIRIWIPACSTGEEAYSVAICLLEFLEDRVQDYRIQIFGTDVDEGSIQHARAGFYPPNIALDVSPERLQRFFVSKDGGYQVNRRVRDLVVFSAQNVAKDAPFSRLDLVSCRNLLIYLQPAMQKKVLRILHYALQPNAFLMLGTSETVGDASELFALVDRKNKIYSRKHLSARGTFDIGFGVQSPDAVTPIHPGMGHRPTTNLALLADRKILDLYGPPGVVVNDDLEVVHIRARTGAYLEPTPGAPSFNILRLARPELHVDLRRAIHDAQARNERVSVDSKLVDGTTTRAFKLEVVPIVEPESRTRCMLVLFHEPAAPREAARALTSVEASSPEGQRNQELERELLVTKEYLQSTIEELESTNEELKSSNEELQSANEELQSTNEELETSKEELQSANEELTTVNDELHSRMGELEQTNDDLHNVLTGVGNAVVIIGLDLRIRRYTHMAEKLLNLVPGDIGRSVSLLNGFMNGLRVEDLAAEVISRLTPIVRDVACVDQRWYSLHVTPYKTLDHAIKGAVIVLVDADVRKRALELDRGVAEYASNFLGVIGHPLMIVDRKLRVIWVNEPYLLEFQVVAEETLGNPLPKLGVGQWDDSRLASLLEGTLATGSAFRDYAIESDFPNLGKRRVKVSGSRIPPLANEPLLILLSFQIEADPPRTGAS